MLVPYSECPFGLIALLVVVLKFKFFLILLRDQPMFMACFACLGHYWLHTRTLLTTRPGHDSLHSWDTTGYTLI